MKISIIIFLLIASLTSFAQGNVTDSSIALKDNTIFSESDNSNGAGIFLFAGRNGLGNARRTLIKFPVLSLQPDSVKGVRVRIFINQVSNTSVRTFRLHKLLNDWGQGTSNSAGGTGASPTTNDATWNFKFYNSQSWTTAGGDYEATASATINAGDVGFYEFNSPGLLADYKSWINDPSGNFGWILIGDEVVNNSAKRLSSREASSAEASKIFVGYNTTVVPVTLTKFQARINNGLAHLSWQTSSEYNNNMFRIEHSYDGRVFTQIGIVNGAGNSSEVKNYSFEHRFSGEENYYRLVMIDRFGAQTFSEIIRLETKHSQQLLISPNPADGFIRLSGIEISNKDLVEIIDQQGVFVERVNINNGFINIGNLKAGKYFVRVIGEKGYSGRFVKY